MGSKKQRGGDRPGRAAGAKAAGKAAGAKAAKAAQKEADGRTGSKGLSPGREPKKSRKKKRPPSPAPAGRSLPAGQEDRVGGPVDRYRRATEALEVHQAAVARLSAERAEAAAEAYDSGLSLRALAVELGVSSSRAHQLVHEARSRQVG